MAEVTNGGQEQLRQPPLARGRETRHAYQIPPIDLLELKRSSSSLADFFFYRGEPLYHSVLKASASGHKKIPEYDGISPQEMYRLHDAVRILDSMTYLSLSDKYAFFADFFHKSSPPSRDEKCVSDHLHIPLPTLGFLEHEARQKRDIDYAAFRNVVTIRDQLRVQNSTYLPDEFDAVVHETFKANPPTHLSLKEIAMQIKAKLVGKYDAVDALKDDSLLQRVIRSRKMLVDIDMLNDRHLANRKLLAAKATESDIVAAYNALTPNLQHTIGNLVVVTGYSEGTVRKYLADNNLAYLPPLADIDIVAQAYRRLALAHNHILPEIARYTGFTEQVVRARLRALGEEYTPLSRSERITYIAQEIRDVASILAEQQQINVADIPFEEIVEELQTRGIDMTVEQLDSFWNNHQHGRLQGLRLRSHAKLTDAQIEQARQYRIAGLSQEEIAQRLRTSQPVISRILASTERLQS